MKAPLLILVLAAASTALAQPPPAPTDAEVAAHAMVLELAGAFSNDGFKLRDGNWTGKLAEGESKTIEVNLYAGNQYWFSVGTTPEAKKLSVVVFDGNGKPLATENYQEGQTAAAGLAPDVSGPYYVQVKQLSGSPATFCMIYSYK